MLSSNRPVNTENRLLQNHIRYSENTMEKIASASAGMSLLRLKKHYGVDITDERTDTLLIEALGEFIKAVSGEKVEPDADSKSAIENFIKRILEPFDQFDTVTLYLPRGSSFEDTQMMFSLKQVFILVWRALHDTGNDDKESVAMRQKSLLDMMILLETKPICHHGIRHELLSNLNQIHPMVDFIVSADAFFMQHYRQALEKPLRKALENLEVVDDALQAAILTWLDTGSAIELFARLKIADKTRAELTQEMIRHGSNTRASHVANRFAKVDAPFARDLNFAKDNALLHLEALLTFPETNNERMDQALAKVVEWLKSGYRLRSEEDRKTCALHYYIFLTAQKLNRYYVLLVTSSLDSGEIIVESQNIINAHMQAIIAGNAPPIPDQAQQETLARLHAMITKACADKQVDFITNIFGLWQAAEQTNGRQSLCRRLLDKEMQKKIILGDTEVVRWQATNAAGEVHVSPYEINRIFLHAIFTPVEEWSDDFARMYQEVLAFVKKGFNEVNSRSAQLKRDSYPDVLMDQLDYLQAQYRFIKTRDQAGVESAAPIEPYELFIINPATIRTIKQWCHFAKYADEAWREAAFRPVEAMLVRECNQIQNKYLLLSKIQQDLPKKYKLNFLVKVFSAGMILGYAINNKHLELAEALLLSDHCNAEVLKFKDSFGFTGLMWGVCQHLTDIVKVMLASRYCDADLLKRKNNGGATAFALALAYGHTDIAKAILESSHCDAEWLSQDNDGQTALMLAVEKNNVEIVKAILASRHCDAALFKQNGKAVLMWAARNDHAEVVKVILASSYCDGALLKQEDKDGLTPLMWAAAMRHVEIVKAILASKHCDRDLLKEDDNGNTALIWAAKNGHLEIVEAILVSSHCDADLLKQKDKSGKTALMLAVEKGNVEIVEVILKSKHCNGIENIFYLWKVMSGRSPYAIRQSLYNEMQNKIALSDAEINSWLNEAEVHFSPYQVNWAFVHAIFTPVEEWTDDFFKMYQIMLAVKMLARVKQGAEQPDLYPAELLKQLDYLEAQYHFIKHRDQLGENSVAPIEPKNLFIINPAAIRTIKQWCEFAKCFDFRYWEAAFKPIEKLLIDECKASDDKDDLIKQLAPYLPVSCKWDFLVKAFAPETILYYAAKSKNSSMIQLVLAFENCSAETLKKTDKNSNTALALAIDSDAAEAVKVIVASKHCDVDVLKQKGKDGKTALIWAVCFDEKISGYFSNGFFGSSTGRSRRSSPKCDPHTLKLILNSPHCTAEVLNQQDNEGKTALVCAVSRGDADAVKAILESPGCNEDVVTPAFDILNQDSAPMVEKLIREYMGRYDCLYR